MASPNLNDFMEDGVGNLVHKDNVKEIDKTRDTLVKEQIGKVLEFQEQMRGFKKVMVSEIYAFLDLAAQDYKVNVVGSKGNFTLYSFDKKLKITVQISDTLVFDERLQAAKTIIDECLNSWTEESRPEIRTIVNNAFAVNKQGNINTRQILQLRQYNIDDERWQEAMAAISDSLQVAGTKSYIRFHRKVGEQGHWKMIPLDFAAIEGVGHGH